MYRSQVSPLRSSVFILLCCTLCLLIFALTTSDLRITYAPRRPFCDSMLESLAFSGSCVSFSGDSSRSHRASLDTSSSIGDSSSLSRHADSSSNLSIADAIYVVSLPRRRDRRRMMDRLGRALQMKWHYWDALDKDDPLVDNIMYSLALQRRNTNPRNQFVWVRKTDRWRMNYEIVPPYSLPAGFLKEDETKTSTGPGDRLFCAIEENTIPNYNDTSVVPYYKILQRGMVACYYSHARLIAHIVRQTQNVREESWNGRDGVSLILEDDVDVEWDIRERLENMWSDLPRDWEVVFLGHCWSYENTYPPLAPGSPLRPSNEPKCTHAYALSPRGARKLLTLLTSSPFAFSRAIDQALSHLVKTQRVKSFSVVPSIVVQRHHLRGVAGVGSGSNKLDSNGLPALGSEVHSPGPACDAEEGRCNDVDVDVIDSDIWAMEGETVSSWRDTLVNSALEMVERMNEGLSELEHR